jgi:hypothetical protein
MGCNNLLGRGVVDVQPRTIARIEDFCVVLLEDVPPSVPTLWQKIVVQVGKILGQDPNNRKHKDSKFCVAMDLELKWVSTIGIGGTKGEAMVILKNSY